MFILQSLLFWEIRSEKKKKLRKNLTHCTLSAYILHEFFNEFPLTTKFRFVTKQDQEAKLNSWLKNLTNAISRVKE